MPFKLGSGGGAKAEGTGVCCPGEGGGAQWYAGFFSKGHLILEVDH